MYMSMSKRDSPLKDRSVNALGIVGIFMTLLIVLGLYNVAWGAVDCLKCHGDLVRKKVVHPAVKMGCQSCHSLIDATVTPHRETTGTDMGLSSDTPDLCYGCHDKSAFTGKKIVHPPVRKGFCRFCHLPHQSDNEYLLRDKMPELCYECHITNDFTHEDVHAPVRRGKCTSCHQPHEADRKFLLIGEINKVCLSCHKQVALQPHVEEGVTGGHPIGTESEVTVGGRKIKLTCISCHKPHSSPWVGLLRFPPPTTVIKSEETLMTECALRRP
jgi:predicted CXXCH cytochrome family protein